MTDPVRLLAGELDPAIRRALQAGTRLEPPPEAALGVWAGLAGQLSGPGNVGDGLGSGDLGSGELGSGDLGSGDLGSGQIASAGSAAAGGSTGAAASAGTGLAAATGVGLLPAAFKSGVIGLGIGLAVVGGGHVLRELAGPALERDGIRAAQVEVPLGPAAPASAAVDRPRTVDADGREIRGPEAPVAPRLSPVEARPAPVDALREESRWVALARQALRAGEPALALERLAAVRARFPEGGLYQEREALEIEALAQLGRKDEASERARRFLEEHPRSTHADRVEKIGE